MRIILYPYQFKSKSAMRLQEYIRGEGAECLRVHPDGEYRPHRGDYIVGWGSGHWPTWRGAAIRSSVSWKNKSDAIATAVNKLSSFTKFAGQNVPVVPFTTNKRDVVEWYRNGAKAVLRHEVEGRDGEGLEIVDNIYDFFSKEAPLYTKFIPNTTEYRVHVFGGTIIDIQEKRPRDGVRAVNPLIRTTSGGWGLYRGNVRCPQTAQAAAISAVRALGLDFGAVDVISTATASYVLEVNTAPELTEICTEKYGDTILHHAQVTANR